MRWVVIILGIVGVVFVGLLLLWPSAPATSSKPGYRPEAPAWLARLIPKPPAALPFANAVPPTSLTAAGNWTGQFTAANGELGVVRVRLTGGGALKVTATERNEDNQLLCIVAAGSPRPGGCGDDNMADGIKGGVIVRKGTATVRIDAPAGGVTFIVNE